MILLNHIQPVTQVVETPSPPSPIQCCIVLWALVFINLVETFFQHCPVGEGGRHNCTDSVSTKGHWLYRTEKALITCHGIQVFDRKLLSWKLTSIYGWGKMRGVSDGSEVFQNRERRSQTFRLRLKHRKLALATDQHVPVKRGHAFNHFARCRSLKPTENAYHLMWCDVARKEAFENSKIRYAQR